jgi:chromosome segregation ATPase
MTIKSKMKRIGMLSTMLAFLLSFLSIGLANAQSTTPSTTGSGTSSTGTLTQQQKQQHLSNIISKGNAEITRRLDSLNSLLNRIGSAKNLSSSDLSYLQNEVNVEISGLTALKTTLDNCATVTPLASAITACAKPAAQSIINDYRVYALVLPKVRLVVMADDQIVIETNLSSLAQKLQNRIANDQTAGKDVTSLQSELSSMTADISAAQAISANIESTVLPYQPSDYNTDHSLLVGYASQLQTARTDLQTAVTTAKTIITGLKA